jgi:hypothetical protein
VEVRPHLVLVAVGDRLREGFLDQIVGAIVVAAQRASETAQHRDGFHQLLLE